LVIIGTDTKLDTGRVDSGVTVDRSTADEDIGADTKAGTEAGTDKTGVGAREGGDTDGPRSIVFVNPSPS